MDSHQSTAPAVTGQWGTVPPVADISFEQTVPRALVHCRALSEVFLTDSARLGADEFLLGAQLPRAHAMWCDHALGHHDPFVSLEVGRQAAFLVAHRYCDVPVGNKMILQRIDFRIADLTAYQDNQVSPPEGLVRARVLGLRDEGLRTVLSFTGQLELGGVQAMAMSGDISVLRPQDYQLLRAQSRARKPVGEDRPPAQPPRLAPERVGRANVSNVVVQDAPVGPDRDGRFWYTLVIDESHPAYFDHPHDHVTGSLILEFCRQAAVTTAHQVGALTAPVAAVTAFQASFVDFAELDARTECAVTVTGVAADGWVEVSVRLHQFGAVLAEAHLELTPAGSTRAAVPPGA